MPPNIRMLVWFWSGQVMFLPGMSPESLPKAISEPVKVRPPNSTSKPIAPIVVWSMCSA